MTTRFLNRLFSPSVKAAQARNGSRNAYARRDGPTDRRDQLTDHEVQFIQARDSFYMASTGADGWPYLQHRGGPPGFVKVLDRETLGLADFRGNRQYISLGNLTDDDRVALFMMDYPSRARLKMLGRARAVELADHPDLAARLVDPAYGAKVERAFVIDIEAYDWNCPQHITPRFTLRELAPSIDALNQRIAQLEAELARHKSD